MGIYTERFKLIRIVQNKATELQRVPKRKDFDPSVAYRLTKFFGSFGDAILASGLKPNRTWYLTKQEAIDSLIAYYKKHKKSPTAQTHRHKELYDEKAYFRALNVTSWNSVLEAAGLPLYMSNMKRLPRDISGIVGYTKQLIKDEKITSTYKLFRKGFYSKDFIISKFGKLESFRRSVGLDKVRFDNAVTKNEIIVLLSAYYKKKKISLTTKQLEDLGYPRDCYKRFGTLNKLKKQAHVPLYIKREINDITDEELIDLYKKVSVANGYENGAPESVIDKIEGVNKSLYMSRFGSINNVRKICGYKPRKSCNGPKYNKEIIESILFEKTKKLGKRVTRSVIKKDKKLPSISTIARYCGKCETATNEAYIKYINSKEDVCE